MRHWSWQATVSIIFINILSIMSCGKTKTETMVAPENPPELPKDWDLNSDYPAADLKAKDL